MVCIPFEYWGSCPHCFKELCYSTNHGTHSEIIFCSFGLSHAIWSNDTHRGIACQLCCLYGSENSKASGNGYTVEDSNYYFFCWYAEWYLSKLLLPLATSSSNMQAYAMTHGKKSIYCSEVCFIFIPKHPASS